MRIVVVSPHRDDACFSSALALLAWSSQQHATLVINCFTVSDYAPLSDANETHANDRIQYVSALRRREDESFMRRVGFVEMRDLGLRDAPLRLGCGLEEICTRTLDPEDASLRAIRSAVARELHRWRADALLLPMALGSHVDHVAAREAVLPMAAERPCAFYEDLPYAARAEVTSTIESASEVLGDCIGETLQPLLYGVPEQVAGKRMLAALYASQIDAAEAESIAGFASSYGGRERLWANAAWQALLPGGVSEDAVAMRGEGV